MSSDIDYPFLHRAVTKGSLPMVEDCLSMGYNVNSLNVNGRSPLHIACSDSNIAMDIFNLLLEQKPDLELKNRCGETALHIAVEWKQQRLVEVLVKHGSKLDSKDVFGNTPLHIAALNGSYNISKILAEGDIEIDTKNTWGKTPLHLSVLSQSTEVTRFLLGKGADPRIKDTSGSSPIHSASAAILQIMIENKVSLETTNINGRTPHHLATAKGDICKVKLLLKNCVHVNSVDMQMATALHAATDASISSLLLEAGAVVDHQDKSGNTALHRAAQQGLVDVAQQLLEAGANRHMGNNKGALPLHLAAANNSIGVAKILFKADNKVNKITLFLTHQSKV